MLTIIPLRGMDLKTQNKVFREMFDAETRLFFQRINEKYITAFNIPCPLLF